MYILSQILIAVADIFFIISMFQKKKMGITLFLLLSDILIAVHYLCLGALTGGIIIFIDSAFLIVVALLEKFKKTKYTPIAVVITMLSVITTTIITWNGAISLLPMFAVLSYLVGMLFGNVVIVKSGAATRNLFNIIYMFIITSYLGAGLEVCVMISGIVGAVLSYKQLKKNMK